MKKSVENVLGLTHDAKPKNVVFERLPQQYYVHLVTAELSWAELSITIGQVTATKITNEWILILIVIHMPITYVKAITEAINQLDTY